MPDFDFVAIPRYFPHVKIVFAPWSFRRPDGSCVTCLGHDYAFLAINGNHLPTEPLDYLAKLDRPRSMNQQVDGVLTKLTVPLFTSSFASLRSLIGDPVPQPDPKSPKDTKCPECDGTGQTECPHCEQDMTCDVCDGAGTIEEVSDPDDGIPCRYLRINGFLYNATHIAPLIAGLPDCEISLSESGDYHSRQLNVKGDNWTLLVQSLASDSPKEGEAVIDFPQPELESTV